MTVVMCSEGAEPTWDWALTSPPLFTNILATSFCPANEAMWRAVFPFCRHKAWFTRATQLMVAQPF